MPSIMDFFSGNKNVQQRPQNSTFPQQQGNPATANGNAPVNNNQQQNQPASFNNQQGTQANNNQQNAPGTVQGQNNQTETTPLDKLKGIWDTGTSEGNEGAPFKFPGIDPKKLSESVANMDFTRNMDPAIIAKALGGDGQSFKDLMNHAAREAFSMSFQASGRFAGQAFDGYDKSLSTRIPKEFRTLQDGMQLRSSPQLQQLANDPMFAPVIESFQARVRSKYPDATPEEMSEYTQQWLGQLASRFNPNQSDSDNQNQNGRKGLGRNTVTEFDEF